jgi:hypothetical protein
MNFRRNILIVFLDLLRWGIRVSDCEKCWDTPCTCGWDYRKKTHMYMADFISNIVQYRTKEEAILILELALSVVKEDNEFQER